MVVGGIFLYPLWCTCTKYVLIVELIFQIQLNSTRRSIMYTFFHGVSYFTAPYYVLQVYVHVYIHVHVHVCTVVSRVSAHGRLNVQIHCTLRFWPAWALIQDIISIHLYRSCYIDPLK